MTTLLEQARSALAHGDHPRAAQLSSQALEAGSPAGEALPLVVAGLRGLLGRVGLIKGDDAPGAERAGVVARGPAGEAVREALGLLQHALYSLGAQGDEEARCSVFRLADAVRDPELVRGGKRRGEGLVLSVLCCERPKLLRRTTRDLLASDLPAADIVFYEDASRDPAVRTHLLELSSERHGIHVVANQGFPTRSWPSNQNLVMRFAHAELGGYEDFATCDADLALAPDWWSRVAALRDALEAEPPPEGPLGVVSAFHAEDSHPAYREGVARGQGYRLKRSVGGCQLLVRERVRREHLGDLDHRSDWGWSHRLSEAGLVIAGTMPSRVQHLGDESLLYHSTLDRAEDFHA